MSNKQTAFKWAWCLLAVLAVGLGAACQGLSRAPLPVPSPLPDGWVFYDHLADQIAMDSYHPQWCSSDRNFTLVVPSAWIRPNPPQFAACGGAIFFSDDGIWWLTISLRNETDLASDPEAVLSEWSVMWSEHADADDATPAPMLTGVSSAFERIEHNKSPAFYKQFVTTYDEYWQCAHEHYSLDLLDDKWGVDGQYVLQVEAQKCGAGDAARADVARVFESVRLVEPEPLLATRTAQFVKEYQTPTPFPTSRPTWEAVATVSPDGWKIYQHMADRPKGDDCLSAPNFELEISGDWEKRAYGCNSVRFVSVDGRQWVTLYVQHRPRLNNDPKIFFDQTLEIASNGSGTEGSTEGEIITRRHDAGGELRDQNGAPAVLTVHALEAVHPTKGCDGIRYHLTVPAKSWAPDNKYTVEAIAQRCGPGADDVSVLGRIINSLRLTEPY